MNKKRKSKSKVKWGKIGAPRSEKRKKWLATLRGRKNGGSKKKRRTSSKNGQLYVTSW